MVERTKDKDSDTIAAIATPPGLGGIGIVRVSGPEAIRIAEELFQGKRKPSEAKGFFMAYGWLKEGAENLDEVIILVMRAPHSYTRQDVVEFQCHGGPVVLRRVLDAVLKAGARLAEPGEFTKRAFLSGRIDLAQAEAVASLVFAQTNASAKAALRGLSGEMGRKIKSIQQDLMALLADLEAGLDFAEEEIELMSRNEIKERLQRNLEQVSELSQRAQAGMILSEGVKLVIAGKPNVGKSTLMNALLERDRVIVTPYPGTTRDVVEETINLGGVPIKLSDTAGIWDGAGEIEKEGVARSRKVIQEADLVLLMLDGSEPISEQDRNLIQETKELNRLIVINKIDLPQLLDEEELKILTQAPRCRISAKKRIGVEELRQKIQEMIWKGELSGEDALVASARQLEHLKKIQEQITRALVALEQNLSEEFIVAELREGLQILSELAGESISEEILDQIFSKFCIGK